MKLPPVALTAPTLCPRCDSPALAGGAFAVDHCLGCSLQLRQCPRCRGIAGPFDRFCGFCGLEMLRPPRTLVSRLWILVGVIPLLAGLGYGALVVTHNVTPAGLATPEVQGRPYSDATLGIRFLAPPGWAASGNGVAVVAARSGADQAAALGSDGDLLETHTGAATIAFSRPVPVASSLVNPSDPVALLAAELPALVTSPPPGVRVEVTRPVGASRLAGRPAASVTLRVTRGATVLVLERTLCYAPHQGVAAMLQVDAVAPEADWGAGDGRRLAGVLDSLQLS